jgi:uncharacterized RDD family membrane protein YckC
MSSSLWYYVDRQQQRQGPVAAEIIREAYRTRRIDGESLVWREGMGEWQPLKLFELEFDLEDEPTGFGTPPMSAAAPVSGRAVYTASEPMAAPGSLANSPYRPPSADLIGRQPLGTTDDRVVYAGFWRRYAASMIDGLIFFVVVVLVVGLLALVAGAGAGLGSFDRPGAMTGGLSVLIVLSVYVLPIVLQAVYFTWMHASESQATLGKRAVGIKVASRGERITTGRSFGRWAAYFFLYLFTCGLTTLVSAFMVGLSERKQGLHDMMVDTVVVDRWAYTAFPERQSDALGTVTIAMIVLSVVLFVAYIGVLVAVGMMAPSH